MVKDSISIRMKFLVFCVCLLFTASYSIGQETQGKTELNHKYDKIINEIAKEFGLEASLIHSIIRTESDYNPRTISSKGAMGLMQLMPETARQYGVRDPFDPRENIEGGARYLKDLCKLLYNQTDLVLAAYNAGQEALKKYGGIPPYPETRNYIEKVKASYPHTIIKVKSPIFTFYDKSGRVVITNSRLLYSLNKKKEKDDEF